MEMLGFGGRWVRFNSKLVRLKAQLEQGAGTQPVTFQFQTGAIKSLMRLATRMSLGSRFNSKLVRLKANRNRIAFPRRFRFQFQTGAIKSRCRVSRRERRALFQFQTGAIKRATYPVP